MKLQAMMTCLFSGRGHRWVYSHSRPGRIKCVRCELRVKPLLGA